MYDKIVQVDLVMVEKKLMVVIITVTLLTLSTSKLIEACFEKTVNDPANFKPCLDTGQLSKTMSVRASGATASGYFPQQTTYAPFAQDQRFDHYVSYPQKIKEMAEIII